MNRRKFFGLLAGAAIGLSASTKLAESVLRPQPETWSAVDVNFSSIDLAMGLDEFEARILAPAVAAMARKMDEDMARLCFAT